MYCTNCGKEIDDKAVICIHCGVATPVSPFAAHVLTEPVKTESVKTESAETHNNTALVTVVPVQPVRPVQPKKVNKYGISGFVVGLVSLFISPYMFLLGMLFGAILFRTWLIPALFGMAAPVIGLVLSAMGVSRKKNFNCVNGLAVAGLVVSIASVALWGIVCIAFISDVGIIMF